VILNLQVVEKDLCALKSPVKYLVNIGFSAVRKWWITGSFYYSTRTRFRFH